MWSRSYRKHVIMAFPSFDTVTNLWAAQADISWPCGAARESAFVRFPTRVMSEAEAVALALNGGKSWIDQRLRGGQGTLDRVIHLRKSMPARSTEKLSRFAPSRTKDPDSSFSFEEFKALLKAASKVSEQSLHKSYAALMKLAKAGCSTAEIKLKVKHSRERHSAGDRRRKINLPLTEQAWRRIV